MSGETELEQLRRFNNEKAEALDRCHKQIEELQKDKERLNWLQSFKGTIGSWQLHTGAMNFNILDKERNQVAEATTIRQAIDAAMQPNKPSV